MIRVIYVFLISFLFLSPVFSQSIGQDEQSAAADLDETNEVEIPPSLGVFPFQWVDLTEPSKEAKVFAAEPIFAAGQLDEQVAVIQMDMSFTYFGEKYNNTAISVNGFVALGINSSDRNSIVSLTGLNSYPKEIPSTQLPNNIIAPFWMDLVFDGIDGNIYYRTFKPEKSNKSFDHLIIQWEKTRIFHQINTTATFQLVLFSEGGILFQYKTIDAANIRETFQSSRLMPADANSLTDFDLIRKMIDANAEGEHFNIGYEDSSGSKGTSWNATITPSSALGNELIPEWASGSGSGNFLNFLDGRDRKNNAVTGSNGGGCFIGKKKTAFDR